MVTRSFQILILKVENRVVFSPVSVRKNAIQWRQVYVYHSFSILSVLKNKSVFVHVNSVLIQTRV
jgi:hypothetical protein